jgi:hypothetical protein
LVAVEPDLLGFDTAPAPAPPAAPITTENEFGAFQTTSVPTETPPHATSVVAAAAAADDFADFGSLRSAPAVPNNNDPFASVAPPLTALSQTTQPQVSFDAYGNATNNNINNNMMPGGMTNGMTAPMSSNYVGTMSGVTNAFGNMTMGASGGMQQPQSSSMMMPASTEDDFGDFSTATPTLATTVSMKSPDPMSKLINLDSLSKNSSSMKPNTNRQQMGNHPQMGNPMGDPRTGQMYMPTAAGGGGVIQQEPGTLTRVKVMTPEK